jgi:hypothetical protein
MAQELPAPVSMELAEFFAKLVMDAFEGVRLALSLQEERQAELAFAASQDPAEFARQTVAAEELEAELARLFPSRDPKKPHSVYVGAPYQPGFKEGEPEVPPFRALLGLSLDRADYVRPRGSETFVLGKGAVEKIREAVRTRLGALAQSVLRSAAARGLPRLVVDSGRIGAKLTLILERTGQAAGDRPVLPLKQARLLVRMVDDQAPQMQQLKVNILSELEVTFKTVT